MSPDLEKLKDIYLTDVDPETREENLEQIRDWEQSLLKHEGYQGWREHDVTKEISAKAKETYIDASLLLATSRELTPEQQHILWAKQDAALWILTLTEMDVKTAIAYIEKQIHQALAVTN